MFKNDDNKVISGNDRANKTVINSSKNLIYISNIKAIKEPIF